MAKNLRAKIPADDTLVVRDINQDAMKRFVEEAKSDAKDLGAKEGSWKVEIAECARDVADKSVSFIIIELSWGILWVRAD